MYDAIRERIFPEYDLILNSGRMKLKLNDFASDNETLCQFLLDPTSMNLKLRISYNDPRLEDLFKLSRDLCFTISSSRTQLLKALHSEKSI